MSTSNRPSREALSNWLDGEAPIIVLEIGPKGEIRSANAHAEKFLGWAPEGRHFRDVIVDFTQSLAPGALAEEGPSPRRLSLSAASGPPLDVLCSFLPGGESTFLLGVPDTSEEEAMATQILALNRDLNNLTRELQKANAELDRLNQLKNQFLGMATHDLRKPLGLIIGFTELLQEEAEDRLDEDENAYLQKILSWSEHMQKLVDEFLNVSVIESGGLSLTRVELNPVVVVERAVSATSGQAQAKGVELRVRTDTDLPTLLADPDRLGQALINLVANAIEFSVAGDAVDLRAQLDGERVLLEVQDQGVGMDEEDLGRLFSPFGRAKAKKTGGEKSTGLGLVITRKIVEAHGGQITVESQPGEGSLFRISLPAGTHGS